MRVNKNVLWVTRDAVRVTRDVVRVAMNVVRVQLDDMMGSASIEYSRKGGDQYRWTSIPLQLRWLVLRLSTFRPAMDRIKVPALLDDIEGRIEALRAFAVVQAQHTDICVTLDCLPQVFETMRIVGEFHVL